MEEEFPIKENAQVYITYGFHENKTLLVEYGFVLRENIYDKLVFTRADLSDLLENREYTDVLWKKAIEDQLLSDFSCNQVDGPAWFLLKMLDLLAYVNGLDKKSPKKKAKLEASKVRKAVESYSYADEELCEQKIKPLFLSLLKKYECDLKASVVKLESYKSNLNAESSSSYHVDMCLEFCGMQLAIVKFNQSLATDLERWTNMF